MDIFLYPVDNDSNDIILSDPTSLRIVIIANAADAAGGGGGGYRSLGTYYHDETDTIDDQEVFQVIKTFLIVSRH